jgi:gluconokinase
MYLLGVDVGTSSVKCCLWTPDGDAVSSSVGEYILHHPKPGWSEMNPDEVWSQVSATIMRCIKPIDKEEIKAVSLSVIGHPIMPIDRKGKWLYPIIQYYDNRAKQKEAIELQKMIGVEKLMEATQSTRVQQPIANIIWIKRNLPELFRKTWKFIGVHEYVLWKLCGSYCIDYSLAMCTSLFNRKKGRLR